MMHHGQMSRSSVIHGRKLLFVGRQAVSESQILGIDIVVVRAGFTQGRDTHNAATTRKLTASTSVRSPAQIPPWTYVHRHVHGQGHRRLAYSMVMELSQLRPTRASSPMPRQPHQAKTSIHGHPRFPSQIFLSCSPFAQVPPRQLRRAKPSMHRQLAYSMVMELRQLRRARASSQGKRQQRPLMNFQHASFDENVL